MLPKALIYLPIKDGGLGIKQLSYAVRYDYLRFLCSRTAELSPLVGLCVQMKNNIVMKNMILQHFNEEELTPMVVCCVKMRRRGELIQSLSTLSVGSSLLIFWDNVVSNSWLRDESMSCRNFIRCIKTRLGSFPFKSQLVRASLLDASSNIRCRLCFTGLDSALYFSQCCGWTKVLRIGRHDYVVKFIADRASGVGYTVIKEPEYNFKGRVLKPDLVISKEDYVCIIAVTVVWDKFDLMDRAFDIKYNKYVALKGYLEQINAGREVDLNVFIVGARGYWPYINKLFLESLGIKTTKDELKRLCSGVLFQTSRILSEAIACDDV